MKSLLKTKLNQSVIFLFFICLFTACKNDDDNPPQNPIDQLPPMTQTGEQTFGCLINGEPFIPPSFGSNAPNAFYQFVDGAYTLGISARNNSSIGLQSIIIGGIDIVNINEITYDLESFSIGNLYGLYDLVLDENSETYYTNENYPGTLTITNFDNQNFIISGTFEFIVLDDDGNEINITDGRFDLNFTN
ncbi:hypothetical protein [Psychroserpens damuponensis]|uniref:hypothetical protein n=1 Tax=Psychroserpens damuponensis TaxID=943936 RepID=UPI0005905280|nr:hypothetical protein [Psychroserpens damuponensis]